MPADSLIAVVTGASRGLGLETSRQLLSAGYTVYAGVRQPSSGTDALSREFGARVHVRSLDVTRDDHVDALAAECAATWGAVDAVVNNAGVHYDTWQTASTADLRVVHEAVEANLMGAWRVARAMLPLMGLTRHSCLVNVSSGAGALGELRATNPAYGVTKAALNALTLCLARELADRSPRILVNAVCPGLVATDMGGAGGRPIPEGAAGIVWAATLPTDGPTGGFFRDGKPISWVTG
jgi:NAD(P)-dependent dehydrogenase (short-subunit alcohol dehydrogenase family)